jgi:hypothetical protein
MDKLDNYKGKSLSLWRKSQLLMTIIAAKLPPLQSSKFAKFVIGKKMG